MGLLLIFFYYQFAFIMFSNQSIALETIFIDYFNNFEEFILVLKEAIERLENQANILNIYCFIQKQVNAFFL